jgi:transcriptional regulator ATRX
MSKEYLSDVLDKFAKVTAIIVETSKIKEQLEDKCADDEDLKVILERTKLEVDRLVDLSTSVKDVFYKQYKEVAQQLSTVNEREEHNGEIAANQNDPLESVSLNENDNMQSKNVSQPNKPIIKLVDINKLVEPSRAVVKQESVNRTKSVAFDNTIVVITSSDEEAPPKVTKTRSTIRRRAAKETVKNTILCLQSKTSSDSSDDEVLSKKSMKMKNGRKKRKDLEVALSDTSSLSDNSVDNNAVRLSNNVAKKKDERKEVRVSENEENEIEEPSWKKDSKFNLGCYVKVLRIPCENLKEYYLEKLELLEVKKLCNINSLSKRRRKSGSENSSDVDGHGKNTRKRKRKREGSSSDAKVASNQESNVSDDDISNKSDISTICPENSVDTELANRHEAELQAEHALDLMDSDKENDKDESPNEESSSPNSDKKAKASDENDSKSEKNEDKGTTDAENNVNGSEKNKTDSDKEEEKLDKKKISEEEEDPENKKEDSAKKAWRKDKLLTMRLSSSDSEEEFAKFCRKKEKIQEEVMRKMKKRMKKAILSDSDSDNKKDSGDEFQKPEESSSSESEKENEKEEEDTNKPKRKRVKRVRDSSEEDDEEKSTRKQIRNIWGRDSLAETTKQAEAEEKERKARLLEKQKKYNQIYETGSELNAKVEKVVLDFDEKNKKELLRVADSLVSKLKPHQASGIQFMWDACFESLERAENTKGSGCILAHCMGLGKTLQVIALCHTLLINSEETKVKKVLVVSPLNTVLNWVNEFKQWLPDLDDFEIYELVSFKQNYERQYQIKTWHNYGGVLIMGYDMFRNLSNPENKRLSKKMRMTFQEALVDPGPDLVVCDEGHLLKNEKTNTSIAMNRLRTLRRIVLTGTPLQNNLKEYFCMVQFIKPNLLGTYKEYLNRFVNPITNGQYTDSTPHDIQIMRRRSHVLHKMLDGVVQRRDYSVLEPYLPPKHEYILFLTLTETQIKLYQHYMDHFARRSLDGSNRTSFLFVDFQALQRICTHPRVLLDKSIEMKLAKEKRDDSEDESEGSLRDFINDDEEDETTPSSNSSSDEEKSKKTSLRKRVTRAAAALAKENGDEDDCVVELEDSVKKEWWQEYCDGDELNNIAHSSKLFLLFEILKECEQIGDKVY